MERNREAEAKLIENMAEAIRVAVGDPPIFTYKAEPDRPITIDTYLLRLHQTAEWGSLRLDQLEAMKAVLFLFRQPVRDAFPTNGWPPHMINRVIARIDDTIEKRFRRHDG